MKRDALDAMTKLLRRLHLYLGCFFAPLLLFFVASGWYQTVRTDRTKTQGEAGDWLAKVRSIHVDSILPSDSAESYKPAAFRLLVVVMSIAMIITIALGIWMAFKTLRSSWPVWISLVLGVLLPILLLLLAQRH